MSKKREMRFRLRKVTNTDWDIIYKIRNNEKIRKFMLNNKPFDMKDHYNYLKNQEKNPNFFNWMIIFEDNEVGYVRILDLDVSIMIKNEFQGKGFGTIALELLEEEARKIGLEKLKAKILVDNHSSEAIFLKNGFIKNKSIFEKKIT